MKTQLKFKDEIISGYFIDENGVIYDLDGNVQELKTYGRYFYFKFVSVHQLMLNSFIGYKKGLDIHLHLHPANFCKYS